MTTVAEAMSMEALDAELRFATTDFAGFAGAKVVSRVRRRRAVRAAGAGGSSALALGALAFGAAHGPQLGSVSAAGDPCPPASANVDTEVGPTGDGDAIGNYEGDTFSIQYENGWIEAAGAGWSQNSGPSAEFDWPAAVASVVFAADGSRATVTYADGTVIEVQADSTGFVSIPVAPGSVRLLLSGYDGGTGWTLTLVDGDSDQAQMSVMHGYAGAEENSPYAPGYVYGPQPGASAEPQEVVTVHSSDAGADSEPSAVVIVDAPDAAPPSPSAGCDPTASPNGEATATPAPSASALASDLPAVREDIDSPFACGARLDELTQQPADLAVTAGEAAADGGVGPVHVVFPASLGMAIDQEMAIEFGSQDPSLAQPYPQVRDVVGMSLVNVVDGVVVGTATPQTTSLLAASLVRSGFGIDALVDGLDDAVESCDGLDFGGLEGTLYLVAGETVVGPDGLIAGPRYAWAEWPQVD